MHVIITREMDEKSIELLEFPQIREIIAGYTSFPPGRELAQRLDPLTSFEDISLLLRQSREARRLLEVDPGFSLGDVYDIRETVKLAALGKMLEPINLLEVQVTLGALSYLRTKLSRFSEEFPLLWNIARGIVELRDLEKEIAGCLTPEGEIRDEASPRLAKVRNELKGTRSKLYEQLSGIINSPRWRNIVQEPIITEREGRYVIPIKVEDRREIRGIVHDISNTGATAFVEPWVTVELGNTLRELENEEKREQERILQELSRRVGIYHQEILQSLSLVAEIDLALAKAKYARKMRAVEPELLPTEKGSLPRVLRLVNARHPLLQGNPVPLSVEIGKDFSVLVITGPNTGGKTVTLKTIGLLSLMAQSGIPVPAEEGSIIPIFDNIFADIGDEQSIARTLSTFSWHVTNLVRIVNQVTMHSLVLLDELGTSTDPAEGAALARSLLDYLLRKGCLSVVTTHFSELKAFAHVTPGMQNASLDFDPETMSPTYHLTVGVPGGSNALTTAARLGLPVEIIVTARNMLSKTGQELEILLLDVLKEKQNLAELREEIEKEKKLLEQRHAELEDRLRQIDSEKLRIAGEFRDQLVSETAELFREIRQALADLRKERSKEKVEQTRRVLAAVQEKINSGVLTPEMTGSKIEDSIIKPGDLVRIKEAGLIATVLNVFQESRLVELQVGQAKMKVGFDTVEKTGEGSSDKIGSVKVTSTLAQKRVPLELDLRGKRAEEVQRLVDVYLNEAAVANLPWVRIVHGFGSGVVRQIVREVLAKHPLVKGYRPGERGEGGDGATVVTLK